MDLIYAAYTLFYVGTIQGAYFFDKLYLQISSRVRLVVIVNALAGSLCNKEKR